MAAGPLKLFLSYAHEDVGLVVKLRTHLAPLVHEGILTLWFDRDLGAGDPWDDAAAENRTQQFAS
jgi:hypothetical protein